MSPLRRRPSLLFWLGWPGFLFILWVGWDSMHTITSLKNGLLLHTPHATVPTHDGIFLTGGRILILQSRPLTMDPSIIAGRMKPQFHRFAGTIRDSSFQWPQPTDTWRAWPQRFGFAGQDGPEGPPVMREYRVMIPLWTLAAAYLSVWALLIGWRWRAIQRAVQRSEGQPPVEA